MKNFLKKLNKILSNNTVSKISCIVVCLTILLSTFTVSIFAAEGDEETTTTESITDVWTSVTDSIMSLLGSAQGVFYNDGVGREPITITRSADTIDFGSGSFYSVYGLPSDHSNLYPSSDVGGDDGYFYFSNSDVVLGGVEFTGGYMAVNSDGAMSFFGYSDGTLSYDSEFLPEGFYTTFEMDSPFTLYKTVDFGLTFIGILAILGLGLGLFFLLVMVITRFIRLRG